MLECSESSSDLLDVHLQLTSKHYFEENIKREFKCSGCKRVIKTVRDLASHLKVHRSGISVKYYKEQSLVNLFDDKLDGIANWSKNTVNIEKNNNGNKVDRNLSNNGYMNNKSFTNIRCKLCNKYFKHKGLAAHIKKTHINIKQGNSTKNNSINLSTDINNNDRNEVKFKKGKSHCTVCNKIFKQGGLSLHILKSHKYKTKLKLGKNASICEGDSGNQQRWKKRLEQQSKNSNIKQIGTCIQFEDVYTSREIHDNSSDIECSLDSDDNSSKEMTPNTLYRQGLCNDVDVNIIIYSEEEALIQESHVDVCLLDIHFIDENSTDCISIIEDIQVPTNLDQTTFKTRSSNNENKLENSIELGEVVTKTSSGIEHAKENLSNNLQNKDGSSNQVNTIKNNDDNNNNEKVSSVIIVSEFVKLSNSDMPFHVHS